MLSVTGWMELEPVDKSPSGMDCLRCALTLRRWWDKSTCKQTVDPDGTLRVTIMWAAAPSWTDLREDLESWAAGSAEVKSVSGVVDVVDVAKRVGVTWTAMAGSGSIESGPTAPSVTRAHVLRWKAALEESIHSMVSPRPDPIPSPSAQPVALTASNGMGEPPALVARPAGGVLSAAGDHAQEPVF